MSALFELWIIVTLLAATFQTVRFMLQKQLATATLSAAGATFSRFVYSAPFILVLLLVYMAATGVALPAIAPSFWAYGLAGGTAQITATVCVVLLFKQRNFAVGITFKKTEVIQTVLVGFVVLGEGVSAMGFVAIALGVAGLLLLSGGPEAKGLHLSDFRNRAAGLGIASGFLFAISAVCYRGATQGVAAEDPILRAGVTLAVVVLMQTLIMLVWLRAREPGEIARVWDARKVAVWIGLTSMGGSFCWFVAFAVQNAAYVKALGQVELILSVAASTLFFHEKISNREWAGIVVLMASIVLLVLVA
ncbi:DMT family transporter [Sulfitobacter sp. TSTF-M16]|uniref:DMT family transporter n=1 Tax=Sulfitobacter aestuariivivens TaxID=2766981 RepID=A0A927CZX3_9RHOB|nr:DMT family transporter [Sulfitobacter aestuariivivens]MBD3662495.1 DMT family transporter [Sulfitobacter aestuariivivens]